MFLKYRFMKLKTFCVLEPNADLYLFLEMDFSTFALA